MKGENTEPNWAKDANEPPSDKTSNKRSRITRACDICRRKKIKCDIDESQQCITCKQYGWECTFNDTTKKRGPPKGYIESLENRLRNMETLLENMRPEDKNQPTANQSLPMKRKIKQQAPPSVEIPKSIEHSKVVKFLGSSSGYYLVHDILSPEEEDVAELPCIAKPSSSSVACTEPGPFRFKRINVHDDDIMFVRDKTLKEHAAQLEENKLDLKSEIAPKSLIDELVARFFQMDHTSLPVIDKEPFLDAYQGRTQPPPATLLVYAICTHTCVLLPKDDPLFKDAGLNRNELFDTLVEHTTKLVKKEYLTPRLTTIQALVLLCAYPNCDRSICKNWLRTGMAVRMAQDLGLHRTLEKLPLTEEMFESHKRLWFCVYVTDRWCCAVMGRPLAIADADCDIELPHVNGGTKGTKDYSLFINFVKLSGILGEVLRRIYSPKARSQGYKNATTYHTVQSIYRMLNDWLEQLPDHQRITPHEAETIYKNNIKTNKIREAGPLMVCYYAVNILLYRNFIVEKLDVLPVLFDEATKRCTEAAKNATDISRLLTPTQVVQFGWNFTGYALFQACLIHVYNCTSSSPEIAKQSREYVKISVEECIKPIAEELTNASPYALPLIQGLMDLIGVGKESNGYTFDSNNVSNNLRQTNPNKESAANYNSTPGANIGNNENNTTTFLQPMQQHQQHQQQQQQKQQQQYQQQQNYQQQNYQQHYQLQPQQQQHQQLSPMSMHAIVSNWNQTSNSSNGLNPPSQGTFAPNPISNSAWQTLFASAATPLFDNEPDWQDVLSTLFDDHQEKQNDSSFMQ